MAIGDVGASRAEPLGVLARACSDSPIAEPDTLDLARRVDALEAALGAADWGNEVRTLRAELTAARATTDAFPEPADPSDPLAAEIGPWAAALRRAADAGLAALRLIQAVRPVAALPSPTDARSPALVGRAVAPDPEPAMHSAFMVLYVWKGARTDERVVFGPRFAIYTPVVQMPDGAPALDAGAAVREDANVIDRLCRIALRAYDDWRTTAAGTALQVVVDGEERAVAGDGTFDVRGRTIIVHQGPISIRVTAREPLPFFDRRLA
jgi:hypothetical protein